MSKKIDQALRGPGWAEVIFGAVLSLALGVVLGAALLILKPVTAVKELPKEADRDRTAVYFVEGSHDSNQARQALTKRKALAEGQSISLTEDEINALIASTVVPATAPKPADKKGDKATASPAGDAVAAGAPNVRIREGGMQVGVPVTLSLAGVETKVTVLARGGIVKKGEVFVFEPNEIYLGSCPVQRVPFLATYVQNKLLAAQTLPDDVAAVWKRASNVAIEGNTLKVTLQ